MTNEAERFDVETISSNLLEPMFALDADGKFGFVNERFLDITQLSRESVLDADYTRLERFVDDDFPDFCAAFAVVVQGNSDEERIELSMLHPQSAPVPRRLPAEVRLTPIIEDGTPSGVLVVLRDISQRKARERELRQNERRFEAIFEDPKMLIGLLEPDGTLVHVNQTAIDFIGCNREELRGELFWETPWWEHSEELQTDLQQWIKRAATGEYVEYEADHMVKEDEPLSVSGTIRPVRNDGDEVVSLIVSARDITERKDRERMLEREREHLDKFASILTHELRNPLHIASGHLELSQREFNSDHLETVESALDRMEEIIDQTLILARSGQMLGETESVDLSNLVASCWLNGTTAEADVQIEDLPTIRANPSQTRRLFQNLFRNAVEHGGDDVTVWVGTIDANGFYVEDDGPGVPEAEQKEIFTSGYTTASDGTGLGLSIVTEIVNAHGWEIEVTDGIDGGARFEITDVRFVES